MILAETEPRLFMARRRDGRLIDFLEEDIDAYSDAQIGAAVRDIHRGCRKSLRDYLTLEPIMNAAEEERVTIAADFDPAAIRLAGGTRALIEVARDHVVRDAPPRPIELADRVSETNHDGQDLARR